MITIEYSKHGLAVSDDSVENFALKLFNTNKDFYTSTESLILAFRVLIAEGKIPHDKVQFEYDGQIIRLYKNGTFEPQPKGFCDCQYDMLIRLMMAQ